MSLGLLQLQNGQVRVVTANTTTGTYDKLALGDRPVLYISGQSASPLDDSGYGHQVTASNSPTLASGTLPNGDNALVFNGSNQYLEVANSIDLSVTNTGALTLEAWLRPDVLDFPHTEGSPVSLSGQGAYVHWMGKGATNAEEYTARMYNLDDSSRPNRISGYCFNASGGLGVGSYAQDTVTAGNWIHYALIINTANTDTNYPHGYTKIYKNGQQRDQDSLFDQVLLPSPYYISPQAGNAPFRVATRDFASWFEGAIAKVAIYPYELSAAQLWAHYANMVPPIVGSARHVGLVGSNESYTTGPTTLAITLAESVPVGATLVARLGQSFTSAAPSVGDSRGNTWTVQKTSKDTGQTIRGTLLTCPVTTALQVGDTVTATYPSGTTARQMAVDEFVLVKSPTALDANNTASYSTSTQLGTNISMTTTRASDLLIGMVLCDGDNTVTYAEDPTFTSLARVGATNVPFTTNGAFRSVGATGTYHYEPTINPAEIAVEIIVALQGA